MKEEIQSWILVNQSKFSDLFNFVLVTQNRSKANMMKIRVISEIDPTPGGVGDG